MQNAVFFAFWKSCIAFFTQIMLVCSRLAQQYEKRQTDYFVAIHPVPDHFTAG